MNMFFPHFWPAYYFDIVDLFPSVEPFELKLHIVAGMYIFVLFGWIDIIGVGLGVYVKDHFVGSGYEFV